MMNYPLSQVPSRAAKPRTSGLTMVMDKGLSAREAEDMIDVAGEFIDIVKLGWATSIVSGGLERKLDIYRKNNIPFYFGGTLFEAFYIRGELDAFIGILEKYGLEYLEVSTGSIDMEESDKCAVIERLAKNYTVLSEVGSKHPDIVYPPYKWVDMIQRELNAGSWRVIAEARESGTVGMFHSDGKVRSDLIEEIMRDISPEKLIWEAPIKDQQVWFVKLIGPNVNLGNIPSSEIIALETVRLGLRGDTFFNFLDK